MDHLDRKQDAQGIQENPEKQFVVNHEKIPGAAIDLTTNDLELRPEVIKALQEIEKSLKPNYKPPGNFQNFFRKFGSHVNHGVIEFEGILISKREKIDKRTNDIDGNGSTS